VESQRIQPPPFNQARPRARVRHFGDWVISGFLLIIGLAGLKVSIDGHYWSLLTNQESTGESVGSLLPKELGVRFRQSRSPLWIDLETAPRGLSPGDVIFTSPKTSAVMEFSGGGQAEIGPSSLVVVEAPSPPPTQNSWLGSLVRLSEKVAKTSSHSPILKIQKGTVQVKVRARANPVQIEAAGKRLKISAGERDSSLAIDFDPKRGNEIQLKQDASAPSVKITAMTQKNEPTSDSSRPSSGGSSDSGSDSPSSTSSAEKEIKIEAGKPTTFALSSLPNFSSPSPSTSRTSHDIPSTPQDAPAQGLLDPRGSKLLDEVELAMEPSPKEPFTSNQSTHPAEALAHGPNTSTHLAPVLPALFEKGSTTLEKPLVSQNPSLVPLTITPKAATVPLLAIGAPATSLPAAAPQAIESPRPSVTTVTPPRPTTESSTAKAETISSQKSETKIVQGSPGATAQSKTGPAAARHLAESSAPKKINPSTQPQPLAFGIELLPTRDLGPEQEELLGRDPQKLNKIPRVPLGERRKATQDEPDDFLIQIHWRLRAPRTPASVSPYRIEIAASSGKVLYQAETPTTEHLVILESLAQASRLNLKIRVTSGNGSTGLESPWTPLAVELAPPRLTQPVNGAREKLGPPLLLTWSRGAASRYQLQISKSPQFSDSEIDDEVTENLWVLESEKNKFSKGTYFWRARRLVELPGSKTQKSPWSRAESFILEEK
jgi:hypothetical protein